MQCSCGHRLCYGDIFCEGCGFKQHWTQISDTAANSTPDETFTSMDDFISCAICFETFTDPKILNCHHTFCEPCLHKLPAPAWRLTCPTCRQDTPLPVPGGTKALTADFKINQLIDKDKNKKLKLKSLGREVQKCDLCQNAQAQVACFDCELLFCANCKEEHKMRSREDAHGLINVTSDLMCGSHPKELCIFFCHDCKQGLCRKCGFKCNAKDHNCIKMNSYQEYKKQLQCDLKNIGSSLETLIHDRNLKCDVHECLYQFEELISNVTQKIRTIQDLSSEYLRKAKSQIDGDEDNEIDDMISRHEHALEEITESLKKSPTGFMATFVDLKKNVAELNDLQSNMSEGIEVGEAGANIETVITSYKEAVEDEISQINTLLTDFSSSLTSESVRLKRPTLAYSDESFNPLSKYQAMRGGQYRKRPNRRGRGQLRDFFSRLT